jgi:hypothetical protein
VDAAGREEVKAAVDLARWQGEMEERMRAGGKDFDELREGQARLEDKLGKVQVELASVKTKVGLYGAIGGMAGSVVVGLILVIATKAFG